MPSAMPRRRRGGRRRASPGPRRHEHAEQREHGGEHRTGEQRPLEQRMARLIHRAQSPPRRGAIARSCCGDVERRPPGGVPTHRAPPAPRPPARPGADDRHRATSAPSAHDAGRRRASLSRRRTEGAHGRAGSSPTAAAHVARRGPGGSARAARADGRPAPAGARSSGSATATLPFPKGGTSTSRTVTVFTRDSRRAAGATPPPDRSAVAATAGLSAASATPTPPHPRPSPTPPSFLRPARRRTRRAPRQPLAPGCSRGLSARDARRSRASAVRARRRPTKAATRVRWRAIPAGRPGGGPRSTREGSPGAPSAGPARRPRAGRRLAGRRHVDDERGDWVATVFVGRPVERRDDLVAPVRGACVAARASSALAENAGVRPGPEARLERPASARPQHGGAAGGVGRRASVRAEPSASRTRHAHEEQCPPPTPRRRRRARGCGRHRTTRRGAGPAPASAARRALSGSASRAATTHPARRRAGGGVRGRDAIDLGPAPRRGPPRQHAGLKEERRRPPSRRWTFAHVDWGAPATTRPGGPPPPATSTRRRRRAPPSAAAALPAPRRAERHRADEREMAARRAARRTLGQRSGRGGLTPRPLPPRRPPASQKDVPRAALAKVIARGGQRAIGTAPRGRRAIRPRVPSAGATRATPMLDDVRRTSRPSQGHRRPSASSRSSAPGAPTRACSTTSGYYGTMTPLAQMANGVRTADDHGRPWDRA